jgi:hypothetical protein
MGDGVLLWKAGKDSGVYALGEVATEPAPLPDADVHWSAASRSDALEPRPRVRVKILSTYLDRPLLRSQLKMDPKLSSLSILRFAQGTNFPVSDGEWARLQELLGVTEPSRPEILEPGLDVAEIHLRQALARNLAQVELGLEPFFPEKYEEYPVPGGRIDLLCKDVNGIPVIVELKRNHWDADKAVGQVARYMGWAQEAISNDGKVRGILLVLDEAIHDSKLQTAVRVIPGLELRRYAISFKVQ